MESKSKLRLSIHKKSNLQGRNVGSVELFGQGNDSNKDRNECFRIEDTATAAVELALLLKLVTLMIFTLNPRKQREFSESLL